MPFYTYVCAEGHETTVRASYEDEIRHCACGGVGRRKPFYGDNETYQPGESGHFEPDHERFLDRAADVEYAYTKAEQEVGGYVKRPKWLNAGVARARSRIIEGGTAKELREVTRLAGSIDKTRKHK